LDLHKSFAAHDRPLYQFVTGSTPKFDPLVKSRFLTAESTLAQKVKHAILIGYLCALCVLGGEFELLRTCQVCTAAKRFKRRQGIIRFFGRHQNMIMMAGGSDVGADSPLRQLA
jgi:hypothetical protein